MVLDGTFRRAYEGSLGNVRKKMMCNLKNIILRMDKPFFFLIQYKYTNYAFNTADGTNICGILYMLNILKVAP